MSNRSVNVEDFLANDERLTQNALQNSGNQSQRDVEIKEYITEKIDEPREIQNVGKDELTEKLNQQQLFFQSIVVKDISYHEESLSIVEMCQGQIYDDISNAGEQNFFSQSSKDDDISVVPALHYSKDHEFFSQFQTLVSQIFDLLTLWSLQNRKGCFVSPDCLQNWKTIYGMRSSLTFQRVTALQHYLRLQIVRRESLDRTGFQQVVQLNRLINQQRDGAALIPQSFMVFVSHQHQSLTLSFPQSIFGDEEQNNKAGKNLIQYKLTEYFRENILQIIKSSSISDYIIPYFLSRKKNDDKIGSQQQDHLFWGFLTNQVNKQLVGNIKRKPQFKENNQVNEKELRDLYYQIQKKCENRAPDVYLSQLCGLWNDGILIDDLYRPDFMHQALLNSMQTKVICEVSVDKNLNAQKWKGHLMSMNFIQRCLSVDEHQSLATITVKIAENSFKTQFQLAYQIFLEQSVYPHLIKVLQKDFSEEIVKVNLAKINEQFKLHSILQADDYEIIASQYLHCELDKYQIQYGSLQLSFKKQIMNDYLFKKGKYSSVMNVCFDPLYKHLNFSVLPVSLAFYAGNRLLGTDTGRSFRSCIVFGPSSVGKTFNQRVFFRMFDGKQYVVGTQGANNYFDKDSPQYKFWTIGEMDNPFQLANGFYKELFDFEGEMSVNVKNSQSLKLTKGRVGLVCSNYDFTPKNLLVDIEKKDNPISIDAMFKRFTVIALQSRTIGAPSQILTDFLPNDYEAYHTFRQYSLSDQLKCEASEIEMFSIQTFYYAMIFLTHDNPKYLINLVTVEFWTDVLLEFEKTLFGQIVMYKFEWVQYAASVLQTLCAYDCKKIKDLQSYIPSEVMIRTLFLRFDYFEEAQNFFCEFYSKNIGELEKTNQLSFPQQKQVELYENFKKEFKERNPTFFQDKISEQYIKRKRYLI